MKQFVLTPAAGKRLIAKAVARHPQVQSALESKTVVVVAGTTNGYVAEELLACVGQGGEFRKDRFFRGIILPPHRPQREDGRFPDESGFPGDVVIREGVWLKGKTIFDVAADLRAGDVVIKGANALDLANRRAAILIGHPQAGTVGAILPAHYGRRVSVILPVGLEKRVSGSLDDLAALADVAAEAGAWFHVDAAYGGAALLLPELADRFRGLARADSVTLDPHKWFFVPFECAALLVRRRDDLRAAFATRPPYYLEQGQDGDGRVNFFEYGLQGSRSFRALKLWLALRSFGLDAYRRLVRRHCAFARRFHELLAAAGGFEPFHRPELGLLCFRALPAGTADGAAVNELNRRIHRRVELEGRFWISITRLRGGDVALRVNFMNYRTRPADVEALGRYLINLRNEETAR